MSINYITIVCHDGKPSTGHLYPKRELAEAHANNVNTEPMGGLSAYCAELYTYGSLADQEPLKCKLACRAIKAGLNRRQMEDIFGYNFGTQEKINAKIESLADYKPQGRQKNAIAT